MRQKYTSRNHFNFYQTSKAAYGLVLRKRHWSNSFSKFATKGSCQRQGPFAYGGDLERNRRGRIANTLRQLKKASIKMKAFPLVGSQGDVAPTPHCLWKIVKDLAQWSNNCYASFTCVSWVWMCCGNWDMPSASEAQWNAAIQAIINEKSLTILSSFSKNMIARVSFSLACAS